MPGFLKSLIKFTASCLKFVFGFAAISFLIILGLFTLLVLSGIPPSDEKMIKRFEKNRAAFERLVALCHEDGIGYGHGYQVDRIRGREQDYLKLFFKTGIVNGVSCSRDGSADLTAHTAGVSVSGHRKYYVYNPQQRLDKYDIVSTLNENLRYDPETGEINAIRHISDQWYIAFYAYSDAHRSIYN